MQRQSKYRNYDYAIVDVRDLEKYWVFFFMYLRKIKNFLCLTAFIIYCKAAQKIEQLKTGPAF